MDEAERLRHRARRWRRAAERTRAECRVVVGSADLRWRSPAAGAFRDVVDRRALALAELAAREEALADLLDRVAAAVEQAA